MFDLWSSLSSEVWNCYLFCKKSYLIFYCIWKMSWFDSETSSCSTFSFSPSFSMPCILSYFWNTASILFPMFFLSRFANLEPSGDCPPVPGFLRDLTPSFDKALARREKAPGFGSAGFSYSFIMLPINLGVDGSTYGTKIEVGFLCSGSSLDSSISLVKILIWKLGSSSE